MILISWLGARQIVASGNNAALGLTTGDLTALVTYARRFLTPRPACARSSPAIPSNAAR